MPRTIAVGDNDGDACLLQAADVGIAFEPKTRRTANSANHVIKRNLALALGCIDREFQRSIANGRAYTMPPGWPVTDFEKTKTRGSERSELAQAS